MQLTKLQLIIIIIIQPTPSSSGGFPHQPGPGSIRPHIPHIPQPNYTNSQMTMGGLASMGGQGQPMVPGGASGPPHLAPGPPPTGPVSESDFININMNQPAHLAAAAQNQQKKILWSGEYVMCT